MVNVSTGVDSEARDLSAEISADSEAAPKKNKGRALGRLNIEITKRRLPRKELMHFSRQLAVFVKAGIPILDALDSIREEAGNKRLREILADMSQRLQSGETFSQAAAAHPDDFPPYYLGVLRTAELTGALDTVLLQLSEYIERDLEARRKVTSALVYPGIIVVMAIIVVIVLTAWVLPRFQTFFESLNAKLPLATRMLLSVSHGIQHHWYIILGVVALFLAVGLWASLTDSGRKSRDRTVLRLPVIGDLWRYAILERFCRVLSSMVTVGVPLPEAIAVTGDATSNTVYREGLQTVREAMVRGEGLARPLAASGLFPAAARQMVRVGEDTGSMDEQLSTAATFFDRELDYKIKNFTTLFEPAVVLFVGAIVGFVAIALVSAMYGIYHQVKV